MADVPWKQIVVTTTSVAAAATVIWCLRHRHQSSAPGAKESHVGDACVETCVVKTSSDEGVSMRIRLATVLDVKTLVSDLQDKAGVGSGTGDDSYLVQEFKGWIDNPGVTCLWAEEVNKRGNVGRALGLLVLGWSKGGKYSYWSSLRVNPEARRLGVGRALFEQGTKVAIKFQGPESESFWGIVSTNSVMVNWSTRLGLHGPLPFVRHMGAMKPTSELPAGLLPDGWTIRSATQNDMKLIYDHIWGEAGSFAIRRSKFGTQNFTANGQWAPITPEDIAFYIAHEGVPAPGDNWQMFAPELWFDKSGALVAIHAVRGTFSWGDKGKFLFHGYTDGTREALRISFEVLLYKAVAKGCSYVMGYVPKLDWFMDIFSQNESYKRATETEQLEYHWRNSDFLN